MKGFFEGPLLGRKLHEYRINRHENRTVNFYPKDLDWPFPDKYFESIGFTVSGFSFKFKNAPNSISAILNPQDNLINVENGLEEAENNLTEELFFHRKKLLKKK